MMATVLVIAVGLSALMACAPQASGLLITNCDDIAALPAPRTFAGVVSEGNLIYVVGGFSDGLHASSTALDTVVIYNTVSGEVSYGSPMLSGTCLSGCAMGADGLIYVLGGWNTTLGGYLPLVQIYDPVADEWSYGTNATVELGGFDPVACDDGKIYSFGASPGLDNSTLIYDTIAGEWSFGSDQPSPLWLRSAERWNETTICVIGGTDSISAYDELDIYNPVDDSWSTVSSLPFASCLGTAAVVQDGVYYIGGTSGNWADNGALQDTVMRYDPEDDSWSATGVSLSSARSAVASAVDLYGRVYVIGGYDGVEVIPTITRLLVSDIETDRLDIVSPSDGDYVSGVVEVEVVLSNFWIGLSTVDLFVDDALVESRYIAIPWSDIVFTWDTTGLEDSSEHELLVIGYLFDGSEKHDSVTVTVWVMSLEERVESMEASLIALELQLAAVEEALTSQLDGQAAEIAALQALVDGVQAALDVLSASIAENDSALLAVVADLQDQLTALDGALVDLQGAVDDTQSSVDDIQDSVDDVQDSVDGLENSTDEVQSSVDNKMDSTLGFAVIGLLVVVLVLLALMMVMSRKGAVPPPPMS